MGREEWRRWGWGLDVEADEAHEGDAVALHGCAFAEGEVEVHLVVEDLVLEVHVFEGVGREAVDVGEGEVVGGDDADGAEVDEGAEDALRADEAVFGVGALEEFVEEEEDAVAAGGFGEGADAVEAVDFGVEAGVAFVEGVVDEDAGGDVERGEGEGLGADGGSGHGEDGVDAEGAHEGAFAGHVGAADEEEAGVGLGLVGRGLVGAKLEGVADAFGGGDEGMAEGDCVEAGGAVEEFGEGVGGVFVAVGGEGEEGFGLGDGGEPEGDGGAVAATPALDGEGDLHGDHKGQVDEFDDHVVEGVAELAEGGEFGDGGGGGGGVGGEALLDVDKQRCGEGFGFELGDEGGEEMEVFEGGVGVEKDGIDVGLEGFAEGGFEDDDGEEGEEGGVAEAGEPGEGGGDGGEGEEGGEPGEPVLLEGVGSEGPGAEVVGVDAECGGVAGDGHALAEVDAVAEVGDGGLAGEDGGGGSGCEEPGEEGVLAHAGAGGAEEFEEAAGAGDVEVGGVEAGLELGGGGGGEGGEVAGVEAVPAVFDAREAVAIDLCGAACGAEAAKDAGVEDAGGEEEKDGDGDEGAGCVALEDGEPGGDEEEQGEEEAEVADPEVGGFELGLLLLVVLEATEVDVGWRRGERIGHVFIMRRGGRGRYASFCERACIAMRTGRVSRSMENTMSYAGKGQGVSQKGKVWMITGASSGFGKLMAEYLCSLGATVVATARQVDKLEPLMMRYPGNAVILELDVTKPDNVRGAVADAMSRAGHVDVLVNNAGYGVTGAIEEVAEEEYLPMFKTNLMGLIDLTKEMLPHFRERRSGNIVNLSSVGGLIGSAGWGFYNATKFAVEGFSEALAAEMEPLGVHVTVVEPGPFRTDFLGRSGVESECQIMDYRETAGKAREYFKTQSGKQAGDPQRAVEAIVEAVSMEHPPRNLVLGKIALTRYRAKLQERLAELDRWEELTVGADFPEGA